MHEFTVISIEGCDGSGKATQSTMLCESLKDLGLRVARVEVPIKSAITHSLIYTMLEMHLAIRFPRFFHFLQFMNKFWWQTFTLPFFVRNHDVLILDRWNGSYRVYGEETGVKKGGWLSRLYHLLLKPDASLVLLGARHGNEQRDEYESSSALQARVRDGYAKWAADESYATIVNADQQIADVHRDVMDVLFKHGPFGPRKDS